MSILFLALTSPKPIDLHPGMTIRATAVVARKVYQLPSGGDPIIRIVGDGVTIDFNGATMQGTAPTVEPDQRKGLAIRVEGKNVTIKNLRLRGYKLGLYAKNCPGLRLLDCDFSYNYKPHLSSTPEREDASDWMSYHHNDREEWLRGDEEYRKTKGRSGNPPKWPAAYLDRCEGFEVRGLKATGGQNALMLNRSNHGLVWNCDLSFNSGVGLAMYRSSDNRIMHNRIDWCVRGFSYGVYNRGQDSAGILVYEQSNRNVFAYNSVTHGGDGFFLWAGQTTMDTGKGGCNDNLLYGNDFSHAATNGIEATFSRNNFVNNRIVECWHGIWGGYSYDSKVVGNHFCYNTESIAWEHGQNNLIANNFFYGDQEGIHLWSNAQQDPNWGYAKKRDTRSRDWTIRGNMFWNEFTNALHFGRTSGIAVTGNYFRRVGNQVRQEAEVSDLKMDASYVEPGEPARSASSLNQDPTESLVEYENRLDGAALFWRPHRPWMVSGWTSGALADHEWYSKYARAVQPFAVTELKGGQEPFLETGTLRGWRYILMNEWGPYDFKSPLLWPREDLNPGITGQYVRKRFEILGPKGKWRVVSVTPGVNLSPESGEVPGSVDVGIPKGVANRVEIVLEYVGAATTDIRGIVTPAGKPVRFSYQKFFAPIDWTVRFYRWSKPESEAEHASPDAAALRAILEAKPLKLIKVDRLDFAGSSFAADLPNNHVATVADGTFTVPAGDYAIELTTDDGARAWLDGKPLIEDAWHYQGPTLYRRQAHLGAGEHRIRVEHFQIDGYAALRLDLKPVKR